MRVQKKRRQKRPPPPRHQVSTGRGLLNTLIDILPFEAHIPGYNYCGPGTRLEEKLKNQVPGVNKLDEACKEHDIAYAQSQGDMEKRHSADRMLADKAWQRVKAQDASLGERAAAMGVAGAMKAKVAIGAGLKIIHKGIVSKEPKTLRQASTCALKIARKTFPRKTHNKILGTRVLSIPKKGGVLSRIIPALASLSAVGHLPASNIEDAIKSVVKIQNSKKCPTNTKIVGGVRMKPFRKGFGLYLSPWETPNRSSY